MNSLRMNKGRVHLKRLETILLVGSKSLTVLKNTGYFGVIVKKNLIQISK